MNTEMYAIIVMTCCDIENSNIVTFTQGENP